MRTRIVFLGLLMIFNGGCSLILAAQLLSRGDHTERRSKDWQAQQVSIRCADDAKCPSHQGILLNIKRRTYYTTISRCTASLYDSRHVLTAGHCRMEDADQSFFLPVPKPGLPSHLIAAHFADGKDVGQSDYASFELEESVTNREFVAPVRVLPADVSQMVALVVNKDGNEDRFVLDHIECRHVTGPLQSELISANPIKIEIPNCHVVHGNSGGAVVRAEDLNSVYGIVTTGPDDTQTQSERQDRVRIFGTDTWAGVVNARCFSLPGWPQVAPNCH